MLGQLIPEVGDVSAHGRAEAQGLEWEFHGLHLSQAWCLRGEEELLVVMVVSAPAI